MTQQGDTNLSQLLEEVILAAAQDVRCAIPGVITAVDMTAGLVSVQPGVSMTGKSDPVIPDVPLLQMVMGKVRFTLPVATGDQVLLVFGDRNLDRWISSGGGTARGTDDPRAHDLSDALAIPLSITPPTRTDGPSLAMDNELTPLGAVEVRLQPGDLTETPADGVSPGSAKIAIGNSAVNGTAEQEGGPSKAVTGSVEIVDLLVQLCDILLINPNLANTARVGGTTPIVLTEVNANKVYEVRDKLKMIQGSL